MYVTAKKAAFNACIMLPILIQSARHAMGLWTKSSLKDSLRIV